jgi:TRCF domain
VEEVRDRYGAPPTALLNLADYARIRVLADRLAIETLDREGFAVVLKFREKKTTVDPVKLITLVRERDDLQIFPPATLKLNMAATGRELGAGNGGSTRESAGRRRQARKPAWWAARATAGAVMPGFSKAEILKAPPEDPRAPDGVLDRVTGLLLALLDEQ